MRSLKLNLRNSALSAISPPRLQAHRDELVRLFERLGRTLRELTLLDCYRVIDDKVMRALSTECTSLTALHLGGLGTSAGDPATLYACATQLPPLVHFSVAGGDNEDLVCALLSAVMATSANCIKSLDRVPVDQFLQNSFAVPRAYPKLRVLRLAGAPRSTKNCFRR